MAAHATYSKKEVILYHLQDQENEAESLWLQDREMQCSPIAEEIKDDYLSMKSY